MNLQSGFVFAVAVALGALVAVEGRAESPSGPKTDFRSLEPQNLVGPGVRNGSQVVRGSPTLTTPTPEIKPDLNDECLRGSRAMLDVLTTLQRVSERLTAVQTLGQEQARRFEALDYRLTRLEVQEQERAESLRTMLSDASRSAQQLTWQAGQMNSALETLRQGQDEHKHALNVLATNPQPSTDAVKVKGSGEILQKIQTLSNAVLGTKASMSSLTEKTADLVKNVTTLTGLTRSLQSGQTNLLTRQAFASTVTELKLLNTGSGIQHAQQPKTSEDPLPTDCAEIKQEGRFKSSGIYRIQPATSPRPFFVFCELVDRGGGWNVIQNRFEGSVNFYREWLDYKHGFGNIGGEFWLGLDKMHQLTNDKVNELVVELQDFTNQKAFAQYSAFAVGSEVEGFALSFLAGYEGDAGDSLSYHAGMKFSTRDVDNDQWMDGNCAATHSGAWWYNGCDTSNLNGMYLNGELPEEHEYKGMYWYDWHGPSYSLMSSRIMIRPRKEPIVVKKPPNNATVSIKEGKRLTDKQKAEPGLRVA
ncbi:angiopoietin-related protein 7-like isoform X2 [Neocloeon triangulifer]|uniref:angiopoietin-related protein 7-like isoform X2 n=1 Tax=Neocloeon triangulifer TaxID=2078957 RepID=UPI00286F2201|nr:angiopoietin-related protein 7-like isoform X2 [Neocloeon triangulifer]